MGISLNHNAEKIIFELLIQQAHLFYSTYEAYFRNLTDNKSSDINALILDYLTMAGYSNAAKKFSKEARLKPQQDHASMVARQQIQHSIHQGDVQTAIEALNDLDPEVGQHDVFPVPLPCLL